MSKKTCEVMEDGEVCGGKHYGKGYCSKHYRRWKRHGDPTIVLRNHDHPDTCPVIENGKVCGREDIAGHGLCKKHYTRWLKHGDPHTVLHQETCTFVDENGKKCNREHLAGGFCKPHYEQWRRENDLNYRLASNFRSRVHKALNGNSKSASTMELLGCSFDYAREWIEAQFAPGMTWENWGEVWHVHHRAPFGYFGDLSDPVQQRRVCHFTNMKPLWAEENMSLGDQIDFEDVWESSIEYRAALEEAQ